MAEEDKAPKLEVWTTGLFGVNVVDGPLHLVDGEQIHTQNAEPFTEEGEGGIRKRLGINEFSGASLGAAITAMTSVPLPDPYTPFDSTGTRLYAPTTAGANTYLSSLDGITWAASAPFERPALIGGQGYYNTVHQHGGFLSTTGGMFFIRQGPFFYEELLLWNGTTLVEATSNLLDDVFWSISPDSARSLHLIDGYVYVLGERGSDNVFVRAAAGAWDDSSSGDHSNSCSPTPWSEFWGSAFAWNRLWTPSGSQEMGYWPYENGAFGAFVDQGIYTGNIGGTMLVADMLMTPFGLWIALDRNGQDPEVLWRLTDPDGTWEDMSPAAPNNKGCWGPMALFNGLLYICRHTDTFGGPTRTYTGCELWVYDGSTVVLVKDLTTVVTNANEVRSMIVFNDALYLTVYASTDPTHNIVRTVDAVTFTVPVAKNAADDDRPIGSIGFY